jgi:hypothetical protein
MARSVVDAWLVEEQGSDVIRVVNQVSVIESNAAPEPMRSYTKTIPRSGDVSVDVVPKGSAYGEDVGTTDEITIVARKFGKVIRLAEEDLEDELVDILNEKKTAWGNAYAVTIDNACLATSAAANGTTVPFTVGLPGGQDRGRGRRLHGERQLCRHGRHRRDRHLRQHPGPGRQVRAVPVLRPHPGARHRAPVVQGPAPHRQGHHRQADLHRPHQRGRGHRLRLQAEVLPRCEDERDGDEQADGEPDHRARQPFLLRLGRRSGPESVVIDGRDGASALTDETLLKMRARRGFAVGDVRGWGVLELLP